MERKTFARALGAGVVGALAVLACSSGRVQCRFGAAGGPDAASSTPSSGCLEAGAGDADASPPQCAPGPAPASAPTWTPPTKQSVCTPGDLSGYYTACL